MAMTTKIVDSSNLHSVGYDPEARKLQITFKAKGSNSKAMPAIPQRTYEYADVPPEVHEDLMAADSHGNHFFQKIRDHYKGRQL